VRFQVSTVVNLTTAVCGDVILTQNPGLRETCSVLLQAIFTEDGGRENFAPSCQPNYHYYP
jgi:hypothetical protein